MMGVWFGFISLRIKTEEWCCVHGNDTSGSIKYWEFLELSLATQGGVGSIGFLLLFVFK
jgi:hypothetical protein